MSSANGNGETLLQTIPLPGKVRRLEYSVVSKSLEHPVFTLKAKSDYFPMHVSLGLCN